ncbi:MAG: hypothetical protein ACRCZF_22845, partial [Gemmataceae bacterium]
QESQQFIIQSDRESKLSELLYGANVGTITLTVYPEATVPIVARADLRPKLLRIINKATAPEKHERDKSLNTTFDRMVSSAERGLIAPGEAIPSKTVNVEGNWDRLPLMTGSVKYYHK